MGACNGTVRARSLRAFDGVVRTPIWFQRSTVEVTTMSPDDPEKKGCTPRDASSGGDRPGSIETEDEFHEALRAAVAEATSNGVDVRGGWSVPRDDGGSRWDIEIVTVVRSLQP